MLVMSTMMLDNQLQPQDHGDQHPRRNSFSAFVRNLLLFVSPSSGHDDDDDETSSMDTHRQQGMQDECKQDAKHNDSLFMEMYFSFPALEDQQDVPENSSCAAEQRNGTSFMVASSNRVLC